MEHEVIRVRRTSNRTVRDGNYTDTTKSEKSVRSLKLSPVVFDVLKELKSYNEEQRERLGTKWVESDRLFIKWNGEPMGINTPYEWLKNFCKKNDMPFCGVHGMRHFNASALINEGVDAVLVSHALGHAAVSTTVYLPKGHTTQSSHISITMLPSMPNADDKRYGKMELEKRV